MAQIDCSQRRDSPRTPTTPDGELSRLSSTPISPRQHDPEEDHGHQTPKKSVLTKVKERAKKLKHSLSLNKKKHNDDNNATPSWGVSLDEDDEEEEEDAEYLGAPMYESELAPESYKETARQRPRANPVISEKPIFPSKMENMTVENPPISPNSKSVQTKPNDDGDHSSPRKTMVTETVAQKTLTPILETVTEEQEPTYKSAISKIQSLTIANNSPTKEASQTNNNNSNNSSPSASQSSILSSPKKLAVSVKHYLLNKFEPAEEDRALSRAISEAMTSPSSAKRNSSSENNNNNGETSVADKVREAVASLLRNHQHQNQQPQSPPAPKTAVLTRSDTTPSMPRHIPISTNPHEVEEEENLGRILQAN